MSGSDTKARRDVLYINISDDLRRSAASCRFLDEYRTTSDRSAKRAKVTSALTAGQIMQECDLMAVIGFIDTPAFANLSVEQKRMMLLARIQEFIGVPVPDSGSRAAQVINPVSSEPEVQEAPVKKSSPKPPAPENASKKDAEMPDSDEQVSARVSRFANQLPGA